MRSGFVLTVLLTIAVSPVEARFVSVDPVKPDAQSGQNNNRYHYANNNPYKFTDPDGRQVRELNAETQRSGYTPPPRSPDDWLGPTIGVAMTGMVAAPVLGFAGGAALANPIAATRVFTTVADIGMGDALGGASLGAAALGGSAIQSLGPFHRLGDSATAIQSIKSTGELRGNPPTNFFRSDIPKVKAYAGALPPGIRGFEFTTPVAPDVGHVPGKPTWSPGSPGVIERNGQAIIPCTVTASNC